MEPPVALYSDELGWLREAPAVNAEGRLCSVHQQPAHLADGL
ncbi:hypothetical protein ACLQ3D_10325 [Micromonospora vinacea]|nr:hypothetical protein OHB44_23100 [Micromonospora sp. NBC_00821]